MNKNKLNNSNKTNNNLHIYTGKLIYNDGNIYTLYSPTTKSTTNISDILYNICYSYNNYINIKIMKGCKILFEEDGRLINKINNKNGLLSYHVNSEDLESVLFYNTDDFVDIEIYSGFLDDMDYMDRKQGDNITYGTK